MSVAQMLQSIKNPSAFQDAKSARTWPPGGVRCAGCEFCESSASRRRQPWQRQYAPWPIAAWIEVYDRRECRALRIHVSAGTPVLGWVPLRFSVYTSLAYLPRIQSRTEVAFWLSDRVLNPFGTHPFSLRKSLRSAH